MFYVLYLALSASVLGAVGTTATKTNDDQIGANIEYGTFQIPSANVRPRFRYWVNDASMNLSVVADDIRAIGKAGAGGVELLGYYLYGDSSTFEGGQLVAPLQTDWTVYGFGSSAWKTLLETVLEIAETDGLLVDLAQGPNQGAGVPAPYNDDGLLWDLAGYNSTFNISQGFSGYIPGWGTAGQLVAAVTGSVINSSTTRKILVEESLTDVTHLVRRDDGWLKINSHDDSRLNNDLEQVLFAYYQVHSEFREVQTPADALAAVPQSPITTYSQNGSWVVDHFSAEGAQVIIDFWKQSLLKNEDTSLISQSGHYLWEDSQEFTVYTWWTPRLQQVFQSNRGYSITKFLPIIASSDADGVVYITDESDGGDSHIVDYHQTLTELNAEYLATLTKWSNKLGIQFSAQVGYNLPVDMLANIPLVDAPECETLGFSNNVDGYRQFAGPANLAGRRVVSNEAGAEIFEAYQQTISSLLWSLKRAFAGAVNQFVLHGFPNSGNYGNTTWPGFTTFAYVFSCMHGPRQPAFAFYSDFLNWLSRSQFVAQTGVPTVDIAFWSKSTNYETVSTVYDATDLQDAGYTYEYISPDNFVLNDAFVANATFAPNRQAFKAMVVMANEMLTTKGVAKLVEYAHAGLPVVFYGSLPSNFSGYIPPNTMAESLRSLTALTSLPNVHLIEQSGTRSSNLAAVLDSIGVLPRTAIQANGTWYTYWRRDGTTSTDYVYVYNDAAGAVSFEESFTTGQISFETTGMPYAYDAWTGNVTAVSVYERSGTHITIPLQLAGNQSIILAFERDGENLDKSSGNLHVESTSFIDGILQITAENNDSLTILRCFDEEARTVSLSNGRSAILGPMPVQTLTLANWTLTLESWTPPADLYDVEGGPTRTNYTFDLPSLVPWNKLPSAVAANMSGVGYYSTKFTWPPSSASASSVSGAFIDLGAITHTARVTVNGHSVPTLDITWAQCDIGTYLVQGGNVVDVVVSTPLGNGLRSYWGELMTSGKLADATMPTPPSEAEYGLVAPVKVIPYRRDVVG